jgi:hypothetical protein
MSTQTIKTILLQISKPNMFYAGLEDYAVQFHYIKGESNSLADALSRLSFDERQNPPENPPNQHDHLSNHSDSIGQNKQLESFYSLADNEDLIDLFVHLPLSVNVPFVLDYQSIAHVQTGTLSCSSCVIIHLLSSSSNYLHQTHPYGVTQLILISSGRSIFLMLC